MSTGNRPTAGFTMVELLVVVVLGALILGAAYQVLAVQERSYRQQSAAITTQQTMRGSLEVLESELREVSPTGGDLIAIGPESIRFRASRAAGFVCSVNQAGQRIAVQQKGSEPFVQGQTIVYFSEGLRSTAADDQWFQTTVQGVGTGTCDPSWGSVPATVLNVPGFDWSGNTLLGAPVRGVEVFTYGLSQVNGEWVLARQGPLDASPVPLIGPLAPSPNGLQFVYLDANGNPATAAASVASIQIIVRGQAQGTAVPGQTYTDSLSTQLFLRN